MSSALIVSGSEQKVNIFNQRRYNGKGHVFELTSNEEENVELNIKGVSLVHNYIENKENICSHLSMADMTISINDESDLSLYSARASDYDEIHIYWSQIRKETIFHLTD